MTSKRILFVEDDDQQLDRFRSAVGDWNAQKASDGQQFEWILCKDVAEADTALRDQRFDCALFDLRLPTGTAGKSTEPAGSDLALRALNELGIPIGVMSADLSVISPELADKQLVRQFNKGQIERGDGSRDAYVDAIDWFASYWQMMEVLGKARARMERAGGDIFSHRIWPRWESLEALENDPDALAGVITRQYVSHLADLLGIDSPDAVTWHPFENYVTPPMLADRAHTGDIFDLDGELWVVLTPQCDMATGKVPSILLAHCVTGIDKWHENVATSKDANQSKKVRDDARKFLRMYVNQSLPASQHFLPPLPGTNAPVIVKFGNVMTRPKDDIQAQLDNRKASVATPFLSNLVQRFGAYISRTGQPNIDIDKLS